MFQKVTMQYTLKENYKFKRQSVDWHNILKINTKLKFQFVFKSISSKLTKCSLNVCVICKRLGAVSDLNSSCWRHPDAYEDVRSLLLFIIFVFFCYFFFAFMLLRGEYVLNILLYAFATSLLSTIFFNF